MSVISTPLPHGEGFELNQSSWQAAGLVAWFPLGAYPEARHYQAHGADKSFYGHSTNNVGANFPVARAIEQRRGLDFGFTDELTGVATTVRVQAGARSYFLWIRYHSLTSLASSTGNRYQLTGNQESNSFNYIGIDGGAGEGTLGQGYFYAGNSGGLYNYVFEA
ncbi:uncharacterized protein METZ01_LOCUS255957, partial [marine metagenome]